MATSTSPPSRSPVVSPRTAPCCASSPRRRVQSPPLAPVGAHVPRPPPLGELYWAFTVLALQGFGGVLAVVQRELVEKKRWLTTEAFVEDWAVAQIMPGPNIV